MTIALAAAALVQARLADDDEAARAKVQAVLDDGAPPSASRRWSAALGGPADLLESPGSHLPHAA